MSSVATKVGFPLHDGDQVLLQPATGTCGSSGEFPGAQSSERSSFTKMLGRSSKTPRPSQVLLCLVLHSTPQSTFTTKAGCVLQTKQPLESAMAVLKAVVGSSRTCRGRPCSSFLGATWPDGQGQPFVIHESSDPGSRLSALLVLSLGKLRKQLGLSRAGRRGEGARV